MTAFLVPTAITLVLLDAIKLIVVGSRYMESELEHEKKII